MSKDHDNEAARYPNTNPRPRTRPTLVPPPSPEQPPDVQSVPTSAASSPRTIRVIVKGKEKRRATGPHDEGWCRAPIKSQFQPGNKGGPGRPKGSKSQDTLLRAELEAKQLVRVGGRDQHVTKRQLAAKFLVNGALEKRDHKHLVAVHAEAKRLFPEQVIDAASPTAFDPAQDRAAVAQLMQLRMLGEPDPGAADPLCDMATGGRDLGQDEDEDAWSEGDWNAADEEMSNEDR